MSPPGPTLRNISLNALLLGVLAGACGDRGDHSTAGPSAGHAGSGATAGAPATGGGGGADAGGDGGSAGNDVSSLPFLRDYSAREAPTYAGGGEAPPGNPGPLVSVSVDATQIRRALPRTLYGNNAATWHADSNLGSAAAFQRLSAVNVSLLRFPGGSTADVYHWDGVYPPHVEGQAYNSDAWAVSTAEYLGLVGRLGALPVITVNYGYATYDTTATDGNVENAARLAADWVEYCNAPNDGTNPNGGTDWAAQRAADGSSEPYAVAYWEIGNEIFGSWETGYDATGETYAAGFAVIADAMKAVDPGVSVGLVVDPTPAHRAWTATVLSYPGTAERADFLSVHTYFNQLPSAAAATPAVLFPQSGQIGELKAELDELVASSTSRSPAELPYYLSEYNVPGPANRLQISLASGLFIAKVLGELAASGWAAASLWDVMNGYDDANAATYGAGDHGFLSLNDPVAPNLTPRPTYYDFFFFTRNFGDHLVAARSSDPQVVVYASSFTGGGVGLIAVNEATESRTLSVSVTGASPTGEANAWILTGPAAEGPEVTLNGIGSGTGTGGPAPESVAPYVVAVGPSGTLELDVPASSVTSVVVY